MNWEIKDTNSNMTQVGSVTLRKKAKSKKPLDGLKTQKTYSTNQNIQQAMQSAAAKNGRKVYGHQFAR